MLVQRWTTSATDPATGCATAGSLADAAGLTANVDVQGAVNAAPIANALPGSAGATLDAHEFGETALDLAALLVATTDAPCGAFTSFWMHSRSSTSDNSSMQDYVAPRPVEARRCAAAGVKFFDADADGVRDPGELGVPRFRIYADYDGDGVRDPAEPYAITDADGRYVIDDIRPPGATYTLREDPLADVVPSGPWTCSFPNAGTPQGFAGPGPLTCGWGPIAVADEPYARDRDFGNWVPATLTVRKELDPAGDAGRFDLAVDGTVVVAGAGDEAAGTVEANPGEYSVSETAVPPANPADYKTTVVCEDRALRSGPRVRSDTTTVVLSAGQHVVCTFSNARLATPAIAIDKAGPLFASRGDTIIYELYVTNTGDVAFAAGDVRVTDAPCDDPPGLADKQGDATPRTLDPDDTWHYTCTRPTDAPGDPCRPGIALNTANVTASAGDARVEDDDAIGTLLLCPPRIPAVAIQKVGPESAPAGSTLTYTISIYNTGDVRFRAAAVIVSDPPCDGPPQLVAKLDEAREDDASPGRFDPGDAWVYRCTRDAAPGAPCTPSTAANTATATATGRHGTVDASDTIETPLTCTPVPPEPPAPPAPPPPPDSGAVLPAGVVPPAAGAAGTSSLAPLRRCLRRGSRVTVRGERIRSIRLSVGGRRVRGVRVRALQRRAAIRIARAFPPGRYRVHAVIRFQPGAATPARRLTRAVRVCASRAPRFTG